MRTTLVGLLLATAALAGEQQLDTAIERFNRAEFAQARDILVILLDTRGVADADRATALMYLAASYHALGDAASAKVQLRQLARQHPEADLDPATFLPELIALWKQARAEVLREALAAAPPPTPTPRPPPAPAPRGPALPYAFLPFGAGQFANGQPVKGAAFLGGEVLAFGTFAATLAGLEGLKQLEPAPVFGRSGHFREEDLPAANALNVIQFAAFWTGVALAAGGVVDAVWTRPTAERGAQVTPTPGGIAIAF